MLWHCCCGPVLHQGTVYTRELFMHALQLVVSAGISVPKSIRFVCTGVLVSLKACVDGITHTEGVLCRVDLTHRQKTVSLSFAEFPCLTWKSPVLS